ncbi:class I SAM-dependent methyltransferase, partial [Micromonospora sp. NPDC051296]|uniref:class I SAM-dependent methyltransferase n=1 Tax=Micromonospora sp. NPDC051296 TaxID=3155046 RepID=UPI003447C9CB
MRRRDQEIHAQWAQNRTARDGRGLSVHAFDKDYWEQHWTPDHGSKPGSGLPANPYLAAETHHLTPGTALDAGCGAGAEAIWLAQHGWQVTGAEISGTALTTAAGRAREAPAADRLIWVETDLTTWAPDQQWDLVVTSYAHPAIPQLEFYRRIADWVTPGGTLLIIGHLHEPDAATGHHPREATVTLRNITELFTSPAWKIETARE